MGPVLETSLFPLSRYSKLFYRPQKGPTAMACTAPALTPESLVSRRVFPQTKPQLADFGLISVCVYSTYQWLLTKPQASFVHVFPDCHPY